MVYEALRDRRMTEVAIGTYDCGGSGDDRVPQCLFDAGCNATHLRCCRCLLRLSFFHRMVMLDLGTLEPILQQLQRHGRLRFTRQHLSHSSIIITVPTTAFLKQRTSKISLSLSLSHFR